MQRAQHFDLCVLLSVRLLLSLCQNFATTRPLAGQHVRQEYILGRVFWDYFSIYNVKKKSDNSNIKDFTNVNEKDQMYSSVNLEKVKVTIVCQRICSDCQWDTRHGAKCLPSQDTEKKWQDIC